VTGWLLVLGALGWFVAIYESKRYLAERDGRRYDAEFYESEIRSLRQEMFTAKIRRDVGVHASPARAINVPDDGWIAHDHGHAH